MKSFEFRMKTNIIFGEHKLATVGDICKKCDAKKVLVLCDPFLKETESISVIKDSVSQQGIDCEVYSDIVPEPPAEIVDEIAGKFKAQKVDFIIAIGGGSTMDTAKAISMLQTNEGSIRDYLFGGTKTVRIKGIPVCCVPTTAGTGAEVTAAAVFTDVKTDNKLSVASDLIMPEYAIVDPVTQVTMPAKITAMTGMDALTHAIEAYVSLKSDPVADVLALEAIKIISKNLRSAVHDGNNMEARMSMAYASTLAGICIANSSVGAVHGIAQSMGGVAHTPHGLANAVMLPYVMKKNFVANIAKYKDIAEAMGEDIYGLNDREAALTAISAVEKLNEDVGIPKKMSDVGITKEMLPKIVELTMKYRLLAVNPRKLSQQDIENIVSDAF